MTQQRIDSNRIVWLDILRVLSAFAIVLLHTTNVYLDSLIAYGSANWFLADLCLAVTRFAVPVFVMISGVFFLSPAKDVTVSNVYRKYVWRMLTVLLGWVLIRTAVIDVWLGQTPASGWAQAFFVSVKMYWFLPMIIGLYMFSPILRAVTALNNRKLLAYFITLSFLLAMCVPLLEAVELYFFPKTVPVSDFTNLIKLPCLIFGAHFAFGYYAYTYEFGRGMKKLIYAAALASVLLMAGGAYGFWGEKTSKLFFFSMHGASLAPFTFLTGAAVFLWGKDVLGRLTLSAGRIWLLQRLAYYSLGVYLLHIILVELAVRFSLFAKFTFFPLLCIAVWAVGIFTLSNVIISGLYRLRWFRKYFL